jgi:hypothetical protein
MCNFRIGQKVVCIDANGKLYPDKPYPKQGGIYTVRAIFFDPIAILLLAEIKNEPLNCCCRCRQRHEPGYQASRFRPLVERKTDISIFVNILDDVRAKEPA